MESKANERLEDASGTSESENVKKERFFAFLKRQVRHPSGIMEAARQKGREREMKKMEKKIQARKMKGEDEVESAHGSIDSSKEASFFMLCSS